MSDPRPSARGPLERLGRLLFEHGSPEGMAAFRIAFAAALLVSQLALVPDVALFHSDEGFLPNAALRAFQPDAHWSVLHLVGSPVAVRAIHAAYLAALGMLLVGYRTRLASVAVFVLAASFLRRNELVANTGDQLAAIASLWLVFADSGARCSLDERGRARRGEAPRAWTRGWVLAHLRLQLCFVYGCSFLQKLTDPDWVSGEKMFYTAALVEDWTLPMTWLMDHPVLYKGVTWGVLAFEALFPLCVWQRRLRPWLLGAGALFHAAIAAFFGLTFFALAMLALLTLFLPPGALRWPAPATGTSPLGRA